MKQSLNRILTIAVAAGAAIVCAPKASATIELTLTNGASTVTVVDGGAGDACAAANCVTYSGALGNYAINVSTGISQSSVNPFLDLNSIDLTTMANAGTLTIETSQTGYTTNTPQFKFNVGGTSSLGGSVSFSAYGGNSNTAFDMSNQIGATLSSSLSPFSFATLAGGNTVNPYSLTIVANLNPVTSGSASFDAALDAVPEPASVLLLGTAILFSVSTIRRRRVTRSE